MKKERGVIDIEKRREKENIEAATDHIVLQRRRRRRKENQLPPLPAPYTSL